MFSLLYYFLNIFFSVAHCKNTVCDTTHMSQPTAYVILRALGQQEVLCSHVFGESGHTWNFDCTGGRRPSPCVVSRSTAISSHIQYLTSGML